MKYSIDTSSLIDWYHYYPKDVFEGVWKKFTEACDNSVLVAHEFVLDELKRKEDGLPEWVKDRSGFVVPFDAEIQNTATRIITKYHLHEASHPSKIVADPFVIALAIRQNLKVVTEEKPGSKENPKIPFICKEEGVESLSIVDFMREMKWKFLSS